MDTTTLASLVRREVLTLSAVTIGLVLAFFAL
jgi:hypothetical protein